MKPHYLNHAPPRGGVALLLALCSLKVSAGKQFQLNGGSKREYDHHVDDNDANFREQRKFAAAAAVAVAAASSKGKLLFSS